MTGAARARELFLKINPTAVIDAPCGWGRNVHWLASGRLYAGVDVDYVNLEKCKRECDKLDSPTWALLLKDITEWAPAEPVNLVYIQCFFCTAVHSLSMGGKRNFIANLVKYAPIALIFDTVAGFDWAEQMASSGWVCIYREPAPEESPTTTVEVWAHTSIGSEHIKQLLERLGE